MRGYGYLTTIQDANGVLETEINGDTVLISFANKCFNYTLDFQAPLKSIMRSGDQIGFDVASEKVGKGKFLKADLVYLPEATVFLQNRHYYLGVVISDVNRSTDDCRLICEPFGVVALKRLDLIEYPKYWPLKIGQRIAVQINQPFTGLIVSARVPEQYLPFQFSPMDGKNLDDTFENDDDELVDPSYFNDVHQSENMLNNGLEAVSKSPRSRSRNNLANGAVNLERRTIERQFIATMMNDKDIQALMFERYRDVVSAYVNELCKFGGD